MNHHIESALEKVGGQAGAARGQRGRLTSVGGVGKSVRDFGQFRPVMAPMAGICSKYLEH
jgi:hypothetical protein